MEGRLIRSSSINGMKKATDKAVESLKAMSSKVNGKDQIAKVAAISAGDEEVGNMVADAMEKVSNDGVITIESPRRWRTELDSLLERRYAVSTVNLLICACALIWIKWKLHWMIHTS